MTIAIAHSGMTMSGLAVLGRALVSIAPTQAVAVLAAYAAHADPWMVGASPRFIVPALDRRKGDRAAALAQLVVSDVLATQARRGVAMDPHAAYADTARVLEEFLAG
jgi:hypothetical protein